MRAWEAYPYGRREKPGDEIDMLPRQAKVTNLVLIVTLRKGRNKPPAAVIIARGMSNPY